MRDWASAVVDAWLTDGRVDRAGLCRSMAVVPESSMPFPSIECFENGDEEQLLRLKLSESNERCINGTWKMKNSKVSDGIWSLNSR